MTNDKYNKRVKVSNIRHRRICWPNPDATCLEGGCSYCNDNEYKSIVEIQTWAMKAGLVQNRGNSVKQDALDALNHGLEHKFYHRIDVK